jgi:hypothetical protein
MQQPYGYAQDCAVYQLAQYCGSTIKCMIVGQCTEFGYVGSLPQAAGRQYLVLLKTMIPDQETRVLDTAVCTLARAWAQR